MKRHFLIVPNSIDEQIYKAYEEGVSLMDKIVDGKITLDQAIGGG